MKHSSKTRLLCLAVLLAVLTNQSYAQADSDDSDTTMLLDRIRQTLPGSYSNFAQVNSNGAGRLATDLNIRQLYVEGEPVFIFESQQRGTIDASFDIYWFKLNPETNQPGFHFAHLSGNELSLSLEATLATAWKRVLPGCIIALEVTNDLLQGHTQPDDCKFEDPIRGKNRVYRMLTLGNNSLQLETIVVGPGDEFIPGSKTLNMLQHRLYTGTVSIRLDTDTDPTETTAAEWRDSGNFNIYDDGRINRLYDNRSTIGFALQLARLYRHEGEPPQLKVSIINVETGGTQAFRWIKPTSEPVEFDLEWIKVKLALAPADKPGQ